MKAFLKWVGFLIFPFVYIYLYLLYSFVLGVIVHSFPSVNDSGYLMTIIPYIVVSVFWFIAQVDYFSGKFPIPRQGFNDYKRTISINPHNSNYWYFLNRFSPLYPFQPIGEGLVGNNFKAPEGYYPSGPGPLYNGGRPDKNDKYHSYLVPYGAIPHMIIFSILHAAIFLVIFDRKNKDLATNDHPIVI